MWPLGTDSQERRSLPASVEPIAQRQHRRLGDLILLFGSLGVAVAAYVLNMGWWRVFILFTATPIVLALLHLIVGLMVYWLRVRSTAFHALCITHPLAYMLLYDFGDIGDPYLFFGLIELDETQHWIGEVLAYMAGLSLVLSGLLLIAVTIPGLARVNRAKHTASSVP